MRKLFELIVGLFSAKARRRYKEQKIRDRYFKFAVCLGDALSYVYLGDTQFRFEGKLYRVRDLETYHFLNELEEEYSGLGYRIVPLGAWIDYGGWGASLDPYWRVPREEGERPKFTRFDVEDIPRSREGELENGNTT